MERSRSCGRSSRSGAACDRRRAFLWRRLTPGGLGLQFTSLLAALAVGLYALIAYTVVLSGDAGPTPGDMTALDIARDLGSNWLTDVADAITTLGALPVVLPVALGVGDRARHFEAVARAGGAGRGDGDHDPRSRRDQGLGRAAAAPERSLATCGGHAFPSGHAAYSVIYAWLAITLVVRLRPGLTNGTAVLAFGIALTVLIGLTRIYLGVHYMSDVVSGWGLGVSAFSACAAAAILATHLRQNARNAGLIPAEIPPEYLLFGGAGRSSACSRSRR